MNQYMEQAKKLANQNLTQNAGGPFGACIVKNGVIIGKGANQVIAHKDPTAHAEIVAIRQACQTIQSYNLSDCELYTSCYPCPMCLAAIIWANIKKVYYGNTKEDAASIGFRDDAIYDYLTKLSEGKQDSAILEFKCIDREETIKDFEEFRKKQDKIIY